MRHLQCQAALLAIGESEHRGLSLEQFDLRRFIVKATALAIIIAFRAGCTSEVIANDQAIPRVAFFWLSANQHVTSIDDSGRGAADTVVGRHVPATSGRFQLIPVPPDLDDAIAAAPIANCNGCERDFALKAGADLAAWGTVQKVSNLILNINVYIEDAKAKKMLFAKSVDIRGNTDESWQRGLDYLLRHYLFNK